VSEPIIVRRCDSLDDFQRCVELQREIWGEADLEVEPATMFVVAAHSGGQTLGAFDGDRLVGYTLALVGLRDATPYLHSHMTGVHADYRDRGVGRMLKMFQREDALGRGIRLIRWTFDPLEQRNAYFNLNRLGAICRQYIPNLYGFTTSPLHRGLPTDRLLAEWHLHSARVVAAIGGIEIGMAKAPAIIELPVEMEPGDDASRAQVQAKLRHGFTELFARGYAALGVRTTPKGAEYLLGPWSEF